MLNLLLCDIITQFRNSKTKENLAKFYAIEALHRNCTKEFLDSIIVENPHIVKRLIEDSFKALSITLQSEDADASFQTRFEQKQRYSDTPTTIPNLPIKTRSEKTEDTK